MPSSQDQRDFQGRHVRDHNFGFRKHRPGREDEMDDMGIQQKGQYQPFPIVPL